MREAISEVLNELPNHRRVRYKGDDAWIVCPNPEHAGGFENSPSFKITLDGQFAGFGHCFGCGWSGGWKRVCAALGLEGQAKFLAQNNPYDLYSEEELSRLSGRQRERETTEPWPERHDWRGISGRLVAELGGRLLLGDRLKLVLPVMIRGRIVGTVKCAVEKPKDDKELAYDNETGRWIRDALFPYDYVRKKWPDLDTLIVTEGMRDPLVTIMNGYPSVTLMGSNNWSEKCASLLMALAPRRLVVMMDPDGPGEKAAANVYDAVHKRIVTRVVRLPSKMIEVNGKQVRKKLIDPAQLSKRQLEKVLSKIKW